MTDEQIAQIERRLLQLLCSSGTDPQLREEILARLHTYAFQSVAHQVLFDCLRALPVNQPDRIQSLLPERLVRAGFPDFDLGPFFEPHGLSAREASELCQKLMESQSGERNAAIGRRAAGLARWALLPVLSGMLVVCAALFPVLARQRAQAQLPSVDTPHYRFFYRSDDYSREKVEAFAQQRERSLQEMATRLGIETPPRAIQFFLYPTYEEKADQGHGRGEFEADPEEAAVAAVWNEALPRVDPLPDALVLVEQAWGRPAHPFLALAAAAYAAGSWRGQPIARWAAQISWEEGTYSLDFLAEADSGAGRDGEFLSPLVRRPLAGEFARWVVSRWGLAAFRKIYSTARAPLTESAAASLGLPTEELEAVWRAWLMEQAKGYSPPPAPTLPALSSLSRAQPREVEGSRVEGARPQPFFQRGVAFTQERWRDGGDYASAHMTEVLASLKSRGVDAITVSPFAFVPGPTVPELIRFAGESDEGINNTTFRAHRLGLKVMLKPQIWLRGGYFAGDIRFPTESDRARWFSKYRRWILHYARLAELNRSNLLCIGNELRHMVKYESQWRELIATVRRIYHGPITYAAHWGQEFETLEFWDALDYIGLNNYSPLARGEDGSAATAGRAAQELARRIEQVARRWRRPVIFTEVGFPSQRGGLAQPWKEKPGAVVDTAEQARGYEAIFRTFYRQPWFYGMYWWKWYSTGDGGGPEDPKLTPMNKPAAEILSRWYRGTGRRQ